MSASLSGPRKGDVVQRANTMAHGPVMSARRPSPCSHSFWALALFRGQESAPPLAHRMRAVPPCAWALPRREDRSWALPCPHV
eukprot:2135889-Prymnesium_polylepis.1